MSQRRGWRTEVGSWEALSLRASERGAKASPEVGGGVWEGLGFEEGHMVQPRASWTGEASVSPLLRENGRTPAAYVSGANFLKFYWSPA